MPLELDDDDYELLGFGKLHERTRKQLAINLTEKQLYMKEYLKLYRKRPEVIARRKELRRKSHSNTHCNFCGKVLPTTGKPRKYCSHKCAKKGWKRDRKK